MSSRFALAALLALAAACAAEPAADAKPLASASGDAAPAADSTRPDSAAPRPDTPVVRADTPATESASKPVTIRASEHTSALLRGRTAHDTMSFLAAIRAGTRAAESWPRGPAPRAGAILPAKRIIAYYGNPLSKRMGVLGEYPVDEMLAKLDKEVAAWNAADPSTPVQPALHLIAVVAQGAPGKDGMYRLRMDSTLIEKVYGWAQSRNALLFLDIQVGKSTVQAELPRLLKFLERPNVHLGLDPEFSMHYEREGLAPGKKIGQMDARDINYAIRTLSDLAAAKKLPPKVLVVHRFTRKMVSNASQIRPDANVQVVMDMDGWGPPWLKFDSYRDYEVAEPVQFTGFKLFYHNDTKKGDALLTPAELLKLVPKPMYIQYQ
ncbi:MAG TPA: hypothetical protein VFS05_13950 [Gemmatimonadaceae bacterium]|nr:hypothetical protein [Gemmatimonadaceae bacterium]